MQLEKNEGIGEQLLSIGKASELLGVGQHILRAWSETGVINTVKTVGNHRRFKITDVQELLSTGDSLMDKKSNPEGIGSTALSRSAFICKRREELVKIGIEFIGQYAHFNFNVEDEKFQPALFNLIGKFQQDTFPAVRLYMPDLADYFDELRKKFIDLAYAYHRDLRNENAETRKSRIDRANALSQWFSEQWNVLPAKAAKYFTDIGTETTNGHSEE